MKVTSLLVLKWKTWAYTINRQLSWGGVQESGRRGIRETSLGTERFPLHQGLLQQPVFALELFSGLIQSLSD